MNNEEKILAKLEQVLDEQVKTNRRLDTLEAGQSKLEASYAKLEAGQSKLEASYAKLEEDLDFVRGRIVIMENEHGAKFGALFDGLQLHTEKLEQIERKIDRIENRLDDMTIVQNIHDMKLKSL